jgi:diadenosine tetraphosphate (Ap4A) HIT family hydrolase
MAYDKNNIFARILRGELPCKKVYEDEFALAFHDINPHAAVHVLVIPKGEYVSFDDFSADAPADMVAGYIRAVGLVARELGLKAPGYRLIANIGEHGMQQVPHLHFHILGGQKMGVRLAG